MYLRICGSSQKIGSANCKSTQRKNIWSANHKSSNCYIFFKFKSANLRICDLRNIFADLSPLETPHHFPRHHILICQGTLSLHYVKLTCGRKLLLIACLMYTSRCESGGGCSSADRRGSPCPPGPRRALSASAMPLVRRKSAMELRMDFSEDPPLLPAK